MCAGTMNDPAAAMNAKTPPMMNARVYPEVIASGRGVDGSNEVVYCSAIVASTAIVIGPKMPDRYELVAVVRLIHRRARPTTTVEVAMMMRGPNLPTMRPE